MQTKPDPNLCLRCGQNPKLPPLVWGGKVVATPNLCRECEAEAGAKAQEPFDGGTMSTVTERDGQQVTQIFVDQPGAPRMPQ